VHPQVDIEARGHGGLDLVENAAELAVAVLPVAASDDGAGGDVQGREWPCGAVPRVVVGEALGVDGSHRQQGLCAIERLDLRCLVGAGHQRAFGRAHVEADDVGHLLDEERVRGELEGLVAMELQSAAA